MLEDILNYERSAFLWMNNGHSAFGDQFMWLFSGKIGWIPLAVAYIIILSYKNKTNWKEVILVFASIVFVITLCDQFSSSICKPLFTRFRPTHHPDFMDVVNIVFDYRGGPYGFISSHAANAFGFATLTSLIFRYRPYLLMLFGWAIVTAYSRIYLGVHFITDVIPGIISGILFGWIVYELYIIARKKIIVGKNQNTNIDNNFNPFTFNGIDIILYLLILTIAVMAIISLLYTLHIIPAISIKI